MTNWFITKIKYEKTLDTGKVKKVSESYLVDAMTFTEAEAKIIKEMTPFMSGEFEVSAISKIKFEDVITKQIDGDFSYYKCKISRYEIDEKTAKEKRITAVYLINAESVQKAHNYFFEYMKDSAEDWKLDGIDETSLIDVFKYEN